MSLPSLPGLTSLPALEHPDLVAPAVAAALADWTHAHQVAVVEIDPELADTAAMSEAYSIPLEAGVNCVLISGRRDGEERIGALLVRADTRADVNTRAKKLLDVRKASFLPMERAVDESGMEHGGITPVGLPSSWRLLVAGQAAACEVAVIGSGVRRSKLLLPGSLLTQLPGAEVIDDLAR